MFKPEACDLCGDCLVECQWMEIEREPATTWMKSMINGESTPALDQCITCYACNETCTRGANPFDLIATLQEKFRSLPSAANAPANEQRYLFSGELTGVPQADRVLSVCVFAKTDPGLIEGELYDLPRVGGKPYFCWVLFSHLGAMSVQQQHAQELVNRLARTGAKEIVCFHDDCYTMLARLAPDYGIKVPFRPVHLAEHLVQALSARRNRIRPLNLDFAYQRPCASRLTPQKEHFIDELFELVGARRVEREYDRARALCCAGVKIMIGKGDPRPDQEKNIRDAIAAGARALVCLCPVCMHSLSSVAADHGLPLIFIGDLARMALGEKEVPA